MITETVRQKNISSAMQDRCVRIALLAEVGHHQFLLKRARVLVSPFRKIAMPFVVAKSEDMTLRH